MKFGLTLLNGPDADQVALALTSEKPNSPVERQNRPCPPHNGYQRWAHAVFSDRIGEFNDESFHALRFMLTHALMSHEIHVSKV